MERRLFGTDGVRGPANVHPMTPEVAMRLGMALAVRLKREAGVHHPGRHGRVVIGKDTRLSGYLFETSLAAGLVAMGTDVLLCGPLPTPGIAFLTSTGRADAGVVISASHNPFGDNGIKLFARSGFKLPDATEADIEALMESPDLEGQRAKGADIGRSTRISDAVGRYVVFLKSTFPKELALGGLKLVVDCGHGAAYKVAPAVFNELGAQVTVLGASPNGTNINDGYGALHPQAMCDAVVKHGAHMGLALDGDADRVIICDERGQVVDGDALMAVCGRDMLSRGALAGGAVVATVMSNIGLERSLEEVGGRLVRTQVGDRYVVEEMRQNGFSFGGEQSGHMVFLDHVTTGDGVVAALALLAVMLRTGRPVSELAQCMVRSPQVLVNVTVKERRPLRELPTVQTMIADIERELGRDGRILVRYSGTEPKVRVMIEGPNPGRIQELAQTVADEVQRSCAVGAA